MSGIAVASDLHLGDPDSYLAKPEGVRAFVEAIGKVDQIILLGDVLDLSIASFGVAWKAAKPFFDELHNCTDRILYVPGNHDFSLWQYLEHDVMVTQRIRNGLPPEPFRYSVPAIVRCQPGGVSLKLKGVEYAPGEAVYNGGYLNKLWIDQKRQGWEKQEFAVAYPNVYVVGEDPNQSFLLTHGHYFDSFWSLLGELATYAAHSHLRGLSVSQPGAMNISEWVQLNYPLNVLGSAAIGQSGVFSKLARKVQVDVSSHTVTDEEKMLDKLFEFLDSQLEFKGLFKWFKEGGSDICLDRIKEGLKKKLTDIKGSRNNSEYDSAHGKQVENYINASIREINQMALGATHIAVPKPITRLFFGHTHISTKKVDGPKTIEVGGPSNPVLCYNAGGWLNTAKNPLDAAIFKYDGRTWTQTSMTKTETDTWPLD